MNLMDPTKHSDWIEPHSIEWYKQLGKVHGKYEYSWQSTMTEPNGERQFDEEVLHIISSKKVLDVGCGHGEFTVQCGHYAKEVIGFDLTDDFIETGNSLYAENVSFVVGSSKIGLPFEQNTFDCAYIRKGPTSAYPLLRGVVKKGGHVIGLHPGDDSGKELPLIFPQLFKESTADTLQLVKDRLAISHFTKAQIDIVDSIEYLQSPLDVIKLRCFGQNPSIINALIAENMEKITRLFEINATSKGLPITFQRYIVRAVI